MVMAWLMTPGLSLSPKRTRVWVVTALLTTEEWTLGNLDRYRISEICLDPPQQPDEETGCQKADIGKNVFWTSFNLGSPNTSAVLASTTAWSSNVLSQGAQLNQPEVNWRTGVYYPPMDTAQMWDFG